MKFYYYNESDLSSQQSQSITIALFIIIAGILAYMYGFLVGRAGPNHTFT